ncbi:MAG: PhoH family protein [Puniceicoccales bacterium]|nr:PhoH family protein [Puniceicoccales bacterium]
MSESLSATADRHSPCSGRTAGNQRKRTAEHWIFRRFRKKELGGRRALGRMRAPMTLMKKRISPRAPRANRADAAGNGREQRKIYVLDTNVLLHDPQSLFKFDEHTVALPVEVLSELDHKKSAAGVVGANARQVNRVLRELFDTTGGGTGGATLTAALPAGGSLEIIVNQQLVAHRLGERGMLEKLRATLLDLDAPDHRILAATLFLRETRAEPVVLVTKDACMALKARALALDAEDYRNDRVETTDTAGDAPVVRVSPAARDRFLADGVLMLDKLAGGVLHANEYVLLECGAWREPARHVPPRSFHALPLLREFHSTAAGARHGIQLPRGIRVVPKNDEQWFLLDALLDPEIRLVTCYGRAGTGKTFLSIAAALAQVLSDHSPYKKLYISRPVVQIGRDIGALPGDKNDKLAPFIQPYFDNLDVLFSPRGEVSAGSPALTPAASAAGTLTHRKQKKARIFGHPGTGNGSTGTGAGGSHHFTPGGYSTARRPWQWLLDNGLVEIEAMTYIRGRSIADAVLIVDEAQNMTPHEAKTVITRMAEGSKLILIGDLEQVDTPYLDSKSNGLIHAHERLKGHAITAHVRLLQGVRSALSELAAECL